jgi:hypothetical protein
MKQQVPQTKTEKNCSFQEHDRWLKCWPVLLVTGEGNSGGRVGGRYECALGVMWQEEETSAKKERHMTYTILEAVVN